MTGKATRTAPGQSGSPGRRSQRQRDAARLAAALLVAVSIDSAAEAVTASQPALDSVQLEQRIGAQLPLDLRLVDSDGRVRPLAASFDGRPIVLVPGYYSCPQLCGMLMFGLLESLHAGGLGSADYRIVRISIDPSETPATAQARRRIDLAYARQLQGDAGSTALPDLQLLTGDSAAIRSLTGAAGFGWRATDVAAAPTARFAHPATLIVVTPQGQVSSYLPGVRFDPAELRQAIVAAGALRIGSASDRIALLCAHLDPRLGRHSQAVLLAVRGTGLVSLLLAAFFCLRRRRARSCA